jgi:hypothetical protein
MLHPTLGVCPVDSDTRADVALPWALCIMPMADCRPRSSVATQDVSSVQRCTECGAYLSAPSRAHGALWRCFLCGTHNDLLSPPGSIHGVFFEADVCGADGGEAIDTDGLVGEEGEIESDGRRDADGGGGDDGLTSPVYVFIVDEAGEDAFLGSAQAALEGALSAVRHGALVGVMAYSEVGVSVLDVRGWSLRRRLFVDRKGDVHTPGLAAGQWLTRISSATMCRKMAETLCVPPRPVPLRNVSPSSSVDHAGVCAIRDALDALEASGASASRILLFANDRAAPREAEGVAVDLGDAVLPVVTDATAKVARQSAASEWRVSDAASEQGMRAALIGAVVDVYVCVAEHVPSSEWKACRLAQVAQLSGGTLRLVDATSAHLPARVLERLSEAVGVRGLLRVRTTPDFAVRDAYGAGVYRDADAENMFCFAAGRGVASTVLVDFQFCSVEGFAGASRPPGVQVAFRCTWMAPGQRLRRLVRVQSLALSSSRSKTVIRNAVDLPAVMVALFYKASTVSLEEGRAEARSALFHWLASHLARDPRVDDAVRGADTDQEFLFEDLVTRVDEPASPLNVLPLLVFGLLRSGAFSAPAGGGTCHDAILAHALLESIGPVQLMCKARDYAMLPPACSGDTSASFVAFLRAICKEVCRCRPL